MYWGGKKNYSSEITSDIEGSYSSKVMDDVKPGFSTPPCRFCRRVLYLLPQMSVKITRKPLKLLSNKVTEKDRRPSIKKEWRITPCQLYFLLHHQIGSYQIQQV